MNLLNSKVSPSYTEITSTKTTTESLENNSENMSQKSEI
jgi:hypothetical protein